MHGRGVTGASIHQHKETQKNTKIQSNLPPWQVIKNVPKYKKTKLLSFTTICGDRQKESQKCECEKYGNIIVRFNWWSNNRNQLECQRIKSMFVSNIIDATSSCSPWVSRPQHEIAQSILNWHDEKLSTWNELEVRINLIDHTKTRKSILHWWRKSTKYWQ